MNIKGIDAEINKLQARLDRLCNISSRYYLKQVSKHLDNNNIDMAWAVAKECPCPVGRAFCFDKIRQKGQAEGVIK